MMTYIDYLNQFWKLTENYDMLTSEIAIYAFLLNECNKNHWQMPFDCSSDKICKILRMSKQTLVDSRKKLSEKGLIKFIPGKSRFLPSKYELLDLTGQLTVTCAGNNISRNSKINLSNSNHQEDVVNVDELLGIMLADKDWQNDVRAFLGEEKRTVSDDELKKLMLKFFYFLKASAVTEKSLSDGKMHFVNWLKKNLPKERRTKRNKDVGLILEDADVDKYKSIIGWK